MELLKVCLHLKGDGKEITADVIENIFGDEYPWGLYEKSRFKVITRANSIIEKYNQIQNISKLS